MQPFDSMLFAYALFIGIGGGFVLLVQFLSLRVRNAALPPDERDPQLGRKFVFGVFLHLSVLLLLAGLTVSSVDIFQELIDGTSNNGFTPMTMRSGGPWGPPTPPPPPPPKPFFDTAQRIAAGLMLSGVLHGVLFSMLMYFATNARKFPAVNRAFVLNRLLTAGIILMLQSTMFCLYLFMEDSGGSDLRSFGRLIGIALVWGPTAVVHILWLLLVLGKAKPKAERVVEVERPRERTKEDRPRPRGDDEDGDRPSRSPRRDDD